MMSVIPYRKRLPICLERVLAADWPEVNDDGNYIVPQCLCIQVSHAPPATLLAPSQRLEYAKRQKRSKR